MEGDIPLFCLKLQTEVSHQSQSDEANVKIRSLKKSFKKSSSLNQHQFVITLLTCISSILFMTKNMLLSKSFSTLLTKVVLGSGVVTSVATLQTVGKAASLSVVRNLSCSQIDYTFGYRTRGFSTSGQLFKSDSSEMDPKWAENPKLIPNEEWAKRLNPEQYFCTREGGTEPPFSGQYLNHKAEGLYTCVCCGSELFSSKTKYDSGSGWPSFHSALDSHHHASDAGAGGSASSIIRRKDISHGMVRNEIICKNCNAHVGHVFEDGPEPTGERFCVNSAALKFVPKKL